MNPDEVKNTMIRRKAVLYFMTDQIKKKRSKYLYSSLLLPDITVYFIVRTCISCGVYLLSISRQLQGTYGPFLIKTTHYDIYQESC